MMQTIQYGAHPDAETLTAFAEQLLSDAEREPVLAHMAVCGRCREVLFLAQRAFEESDSVSSGETQGPKKRVSAGWLAAWRWSWIPIAALSGLIGVAVLRQHHNSEIPQKQIAQSVPPPANVKNQARSEDSVSHQRRLPTPEMKAARQQQMNERVERDKEESSRVLDRKDQAIAQKKDQVATNADSQAVLGSGVGEAIAAPAKPSSGPSPSSQNQVLLAKNAQSEQQGKLADERKLKDSHSARNEASLAAIQVAGASESVNVQQADSGLAPSPAAPRNAPQLAADSLQVALPSKDLAKSVRSKLPSGLDVLSEASEVQKKVALDTAGSLFFSGDGGKHWDAVKPFWTGQAISVKIHPTADSDTGNALTRPPTGFELSTDKEQVWVSVDGRDWTLKSPGEK